MDHAMTATASIPSHRIAIDVGGTFVDYVLLDEASGSITIEKQLSTPERIVDEVMTGIGRLPVALSQTSIFHGTTVALNTIVQERGVAVGLLTTAGFRDILEIGRGSRPEIYNPLFREPPALIDRFLRREIAGRMDAQGREVTPLDLDQLDREADALVAAGVEALAICFLHSYTNNTHEAVAAERIRRRHPGIALAVSHELVREWREFERTSTTVLNAYVQPPFKRYIDALVARLEGAGYANPLAVMQSNGGVSAARRAADRPITTLESGPAGGVIGASVLAAELGLKNVICSDVGGTTVDLALIEDGAIVERNQTKIAGRPVLGPTIDILSAGVGGGSIAWIDNRGSLRVGPRSAGSSPGPACFGLGGSEPTVTDCHLVLGSLDPDRFLGARIRLDVDAARGAVDRLAGRLGLGRDELAAGILQIAESNMIGAIRSITVKRGLDPRDFTLVSYGGGGGFFAAAVAEELGVRSIIVPTASATFSAWGIVSSDYREDSARTMVRTLDDETAREIVAVARRLSADNVERLSEHNIDAGRIRSFVRCDVRFAGQEYTVTVGVDDDWLQSPDRLLAGLSERFVDMHRRLYGHGEQGMPVELVTVRVRSIGHVARPAFPRARDGAAPEPSAWRETYFRAEGERVRTPVYDRDALSRLFAVEGPAIVEEWTTTTLVPPGWSAGTDRIGNLVLTAKAEGEE
ncbi:hydantoinase/oxoprolinase family protein [Sphingomonas histidinilytica]|nr:hydantoinase/oxoprolinase family protein [Rhizorhabdus histidinilytica]